MYFLITKNEAEDHLSKAVKLNPSLADAWLCLDRCGTLTGSRKDEKVSRQEYLKKMEQKKLKELRDDMEDEQYLFDGVKLIELEYGELRKLMLTCTIYCIWRERNARIFSPVGSPANVVVRKVESLVRSPGSVLWSCLIFSFIFRTLLFMYRYCPWMGVYGSLLVVESVAPLVWLCWCCCLLSAVCYHTDFGLSWEALQDERINGGAFIGTDGLQFPHKLIPVSFNLAMSLMSV
ncbi:hypothetical protein TEA_000035 [Camellia sinensis var. sinensis]|uniref:Uncharacterized protein n=1 Tax=Camellia sinensis var. sinensis TaxID=542762 RepID=A0A4S4ETN6_CAMSN|nr:hypothetical protein TEA_000035 [Camellia sinensis var. sinensis]